MRKRKKRRKSAREQNCSYFIELSDWELRYHFSLNRHKNFITGSYWEHSSLQLTGTMFQPEKLHGRTIDIYILGDRTKVPVLEEPEKYNFEPIAVGTLTAKKEQTEFSGSVPFDVLQTMCYLLETGKIKILVLDGQSLYYGSADIASINFVRDFKPEDWM